MINSCGSFRSCLWSFRCSFIFSSFGLFEVIRRRVVVQLIYFFFFLFLKLQSDLVGASNKIFNFSFEIFEMSESIRSAPYSSNAPFSRYSVQCVQPSSSGCPLKEIITVRVSLVEVEKGFINVCYARKYYSAGNSFPALLTSSLQINGTKQKKK